MAVYVAYALRLMNVHTRLIGALDAVILGSTAVPTIALLLALIDPRGDFVTQASMLNGLAGSEHSPNA